MKRFLLAIGVVTLGLGFTACEDEPDKFELTDGNPTISYIRPQDVAAKDSLLTSAYTGSGICIVGNNLTSIKEMYFNDVKAVLNTSYITDHTMLVTIPNQIPASNTGKIYMVNKSQDTTTYDFKVMVPEPAVTSMKCEYVHVGELAQINGQYFVDDPNQPLTLTFTGIDNSMNLEVPRENIKKITQSSISFIVPEGAKEGRIKVSTITVKEIHHSIMLTAVTSLPTLTVLTMQVLRVLYLRDGILMLNTLPKVVLAVLTVS